MFRLYDSMAKGFVYGTAVAADVFATRRKRLPNIFRS